jgi:hypothetical protein
MVLIWNDGELNALSNEYKLNIQHFQKHVHFGQILNHRNLWKAYIIFHKFFAENYLQYPQILLEFATKRLALPFYIELSMNCRWILMSPIFHCLYVPVLSDCTGYRIRYVLMYIKFDIMRQDVKVVVLFIFNATIYSINNCTLFSLKHLINLAQDYSNSLYFLYWIILVAAIVCIIFVTFDWNGCWCLHWLVCRVKNNDKKKRQGMRFKKGTPFF